MNQIKSNTNITDLPQEILANILKFLEEPKEIALCARVNRAFRVASEQVNYKQSYLNKIVAKKEFFDANAYKIQKILYYAHLSPSTYFSESISLPKDSKDNQSLLAALKFSLENEQLEDISLLLRILGKQNVEEMHDDQIIKIFSKAKYHKYSLEMQLQIKQFIKDFFQSIFEDVNLSDKRKGEIIIYTIRYNNKDLLEFLKNIESAKVSIAKLLEAIPHYSFV